MRGSLPGLGRPSFLLVLTCVASPGAAASLSSLSNQDVDTIIARTQERFWGNAVDAKGHKFELGPGEDPKAPLIPPDDARRIVGEANVYGFALWCGLDWKPTYLDYMRYERYAGWKDKQAAFIGMLFGLTQGYVKSQQASSCEGAISTEVVNAFDAEMRRVRGLFQKADHAVCSAYFYGNGRPQDFAKALTWCRKAAESGLPESQTLLGEMYLNGYAVEQDDLRAAEWYRKAAEQGFAHAEFALGLLYLHGRGVEKDRTVARQWLEKAATKDYAPAMKQLAELPD